MKKLFAIVVLFAMALCAFSMNVFAEDTIQVGMGVVNSQSIYVPAEKINVKDSDGDGKFTVNDAIYAAHERYYLGGAERGYETAQTEYGLSMVKFWGDSSGNFGYYVNNKPAMSLLDEIKEGDVINACIFGGEYPDIESYAYIASDKASVREGESVTLSVMKLSYDENFNVITTPVRGATINIIQTPTEYVTDAEGMVTVQVTGQQKVLYTATLPDGENTILPICLVEIEENAALDKITDEPITPDNNQGPSKNTDAKVEKKKGCSGSIGVGMICIFSVAALGTGVFVRKNKRS